MSDPRIDHNAKLCAEFIREHRVTCRYDKISDQVDLLPLDLTGLFPFGYNPTIIEEDGKILMAYRYHWDSTLATKLAFAEIDFEGRVLSNKELHVVTSRSGEDPKFFRLRGGLYLSFVDSTWPEVPPKAVVRYAAFKDGQLSQSIVLPRFPGNDLRTIQKNYVFFEHAGTPYCIYQCSPEQHVYAINGDEISVPMKTNGPKYAYGPIKGGTAPLEYEGKLLRFAHSTLDNEWNGHHRRYYLLAMLLNPKPPFEVVRVSSKPILFGSEMDDILYSRRQACHHWKSGVVFPGGAIKRDDEFWVAIGINDSSVAIARIKPNRLNL